MQSGATADRVYDGLKRALLSGAHLPGEKLDPTRFADALGSSVTPVRDALHRLVGERLVDMRPSDGFHLPLVTEPRLRDLYAWHATLLRSCMQLWPRAATDRMKTDLSAEMARATARLFDVFAARTGNPEIRLELQAASDRLAVARVAEQKVLGDLEHEARTLAVALDQGTRGDILRQVARYHRRRARAVPDIVRAMYQPVWPK